MKTIVVLIVLMTLTISANELWTQQPNTAEPQNIKSDGKAVSLILKDTPLLTALDSLFKNSGFTYQFVKMNGDETGKEWWHNVTVSINISSVPFREAVKIIAGAAGLTVTETATSKIQATASENIKNTSNVENKKRVDYIFSPASASSNVAINRSQIQQNAYDSFSNMQSVRAYPFKLNTKDGKNGKLLSLQMEQANAFDVLTQVMNIYKRNYILDIGPASEYSILAPRITAKLADVTLDEFLDLLKSSSGIQVAVKGDQTIIRWRPDQKVLLPQASIYQPFTAYYAYLIANIDALQSINSIMDKQLNGPSLAKGTTGYLNWIRKNTGQQSIRILIAGSVSGLQSYNNPAALRQKGHLPDPNILAIKVGPLSYEQLEFKADVIVRAIGKYRDNEVSALIVDRLFWREVGSVSEQKDEYEVTLRWPSNVSRIARTGQVVFPDGTKRIFVLVVTLSPYATYDLIPTNSKRQ